MTYPLIIFVFLILAIVTVLVYVIPAVSELFATSEVELPMATKALIATSDFLIYNWALLLLFIAFVSLLFYGYKNTEKGKANFDYFLLSLPLVGKVYKNYLLASFATNMGSLISS